MRYYMGEDICNSYIRDYYYINPTVNDFFLKDEWSSRKGEQPNVYLKGYDDKIQVLNQKYLDKLRKKGCLSFREGILKKDLIDAIHLQKLNRNFKYLPINSRNNILIDYVTECSGEGIYLFQSRGDYNQFLLRLIKLKEITDEIILLMRKGIQKKITLYRGCVEAIIHTITEVLKNKSYRHKKKVLISKKKWEGGVEENLVESLKKLNNFLISEYIDKSKKTFGLHSYKGGKKLYSTLLKMETLEEATPSSIHSLGMNELKRLMGLKLKLEKEVNRGDIDKYMEKLRGYQNKKDIIPDLYKIQDDIIENVQKKYFYGNVKKKDKYKIKEIRLENQNHFAYYLSGDLKDRRKGVFYINTSHPERLNKHELYVLSLHEGFPGHHYEIDYHNKANISDYFKISGYNSYSEGWGLYCESLGDFKDYRRRYYRIKYNILRALRLVLDTGIHYYAWDYKMCYDMIEKYLSYKEDNIHRVILRYVDQPCQALTYKVGERTILYLRNKYLEKGGDIKDFHEIIMKLGPCPLNVLIDTFIFQYL